MTNPTTPSQFSPSNRFLQLAWDNTSLDVLKTCPRKYFYSMIEGYRTEQTPLTLSFGGLIHEAVEFTDRLVHSGVPKSEAVPQVIRQALALGWDKLPLKGGPRTRLSLLIAAFEYVEAWAYEQTAQVVTLENGKPALELSFTVDLGLCAESGERFSYCGHIDKVHLDTLGAHVVERKHTTSQLEESYIQRYRMSPQVSGYAFALKILSHINTGGAFVEAFQIGATFARIRRFAISRVPSQIDEWLSNTKQWIKSAERRAIESAAAEDADVEPSYAWEMNETSCIHFGQPCEFFQICTKPASARANWLKDLYVRRRWNPLELRGGDE